jgi:hypothetical protein
LNGCLTPILDIEPGGGEVPGERDGERQADIAQPYDGDFGFVHARVIAERRRRSKRRETT